jgi:hypothetical protein
MMPSEPQAAAPAAAHAAEDPTDRLARLKELKDQGLMSQEEYEKRRKELLDQL